MSQLAFIFEINPLDVIHQPEREDSIMSQTKQISIISKNEYRNKEQLSDTIIRQTCTCVLRIMRIDNY